MNKVKTILALALSFLMLFNTLSGFAVQDMDSVLYAPGATMWNPGADTSVANQAAGNGTTITFGDSTSQSSVGTMSKYKWDGLHIRVENVPSSGFALYLNDAAPNMVHFPPTVASLQLRVWNQEGTGTAQVYSGVLGDSPIVIDKKTALVTDTFDIHFTKIDGEMEIDINGEKTNSSTWEDWASVSSNFLEYSGLPNEVYVGFGNTYGDVVNNFKGTIDVTVLHDGSSECNAGGTVEIADHDADFYAPTTDLGVTSTADSKMAMTDITGGGLKVAATAAGPGNIVSIDKQYDFDGVHFQLKNFTFADGTRKRITFQLGQEKNNTYLTSSTADHSYYVVVDLETGAAKFYSQYGGFAKADISAGDNGIKGAEALDVHFVKTDTDYTVVINGETMKLIDIPQYGVWATNYGLDLSKIYLGFDGGEWDDQSQVNRTFSFDLVSLHDKNQECHANMVVSKVKAVEEMIDALGEITLDKESAVLAARSSYSLLNAEELVVFNGDKLIVLEAAEARIAALKEEQANQGAAQVQQVIELINAIGTSITLDSEAAIVAAETAYNALSDDLKEQISNYLDLVFARAELNALLESDNDVSSETSSEDDEKEPADTGVAAYPISVAILLLAVGTIIMVVRRREQI